MLSDVLFKHHWVKQVLVRTTYGLSKKFGGKLQPNECHVDLDAFVLSRLRRTGHVDLM